ncbi:hypothetical protein KFL_006350020 [Klebsormidium nitens]|uniref:Uncharacterized protein n=1 Tax=Klebsormidium nitens TaxID=105231 RepID=A0A1Y1IHP9_KLENI|nr:hypothetical protein KFL_006350020 [Klebsormidium nitens]|eukprot:GAQ90405.1 hypothetical protein KFL_006350020 [Klebsormidium nitens]
MATLRTNEFYATRRIPREEVHASPWQGGPGIGKTRLGEEITNGALENLAKLLLDNVELRAALKKLEYHFNERELEEVVSLLNTGRVKYAYMEFNDIGGDFTLVDCDAGRFDAKAADRAIGLRLYASLFFNLTAAQLRTVITTKRLERYFTIRAVWQLQLRLGREQARLSEQSMFASIVVMDEILLGASKLARLCNIEAEAALKTILRVVCEYKSLHSGKDQHALLFIPMGTNLHKLQRAFQLTEYEAANMHDLFELRDDGELSAAFVESVLLLKYPSAADHIVEFVYSGPMSVLLAKAGGVPRYLMAVARAAARPAFLDRLPENAAPGIYAKLASNLEPLVEDEVAIWFKGHDLIKHWGGANVAQVMVARYVIRVSLRRREIREF